MTNEEKKIVEQEILKHKSPYDNNQDFVWNEDKVSFSGSLSIYRNATFPNLTAIGGDLYIHSNAALNADNLTAIGGGLYIHSNATVSTPLLKHKYFTKTMKDGETKHGLFKADGIVMVLAKKRRLGDYTFYFAPYPLVCATKDGKTFAHGKDAHEAIQDLAFKLAKRNIDDYKSLTLDSVVPYGEAIILYRVITGACQFGTNQFLDQTKPDKRDYTIREILEKTEGQYGNTILRQFFGVSK